MDMADAAEVAKALGEMVETERGNEEMLKERDRFFRRLQAIRHQAWRTHLANNPFTKD
jgi:hypothetical protein